MLVIVYRQSSMRCTIMQSLTFITFLSRKNCNVKLFVPRQLARHHYTFDHKSASHPVHQTLINSYTHIFHASKKSVVRSKSNQVKIKKEYNLTSSMSLEYWLLALATAARLFASAVACYTHTHTHTCKKLLIKYWPHNEAQLIRVS